MSNTRLMFVALLLATGCKTPTLAVPFYRSASLTPEWLDPITANSNNTHRVAPFQLTDQNRIPVTADSLARRATIIHFFFTACAGVCPTTQTNIARLLAGMPDERRLQILSHSVTPERDSVAALQTYARMHHIDDARWHLLTGERRDIERLARDSYFVNLSDGKSYGISNLAHTETLVLVDARGRLRGMYTGSLPLDIERLGEDIRSILKEPD